MCWTWWGTVAAEQRTVFAMAGLGLGLQHVVQGRGLLRNLHPTMDLVELRHRLGGLFCNGVGVYVTVKI